MSIKHAVVQDGVVINVVMIDPDNDKAAWAPPHGCTLVPVELPVRAEIGYHYDGKEFTKPVPSAEDVIAAKDRSIAAVDAAFQRLQGSMLVDSAKREEMRAAALAAAQAIRDAATVEDIEAVRVQGFITLQNLKGSI